MALWIVGLVLLAAIGCRSEVVTEEGQDPAFGEMVLDSDKPVLVDFHATWCRPCKEMNPIVKQLETEYAGKVVVYKVDIDEYPGTKQKYGITGVPTFIVFDGGKVVDQVVGGTDKADLAGRLDAAVN